MGRTPQDIDQAINATLGHDYLQALTKFIEIYGTDDAPPIQSPKDASGLSYFGLCVALVRKQYRPAIDLCKRAIDLEFYNGDHYANLARVYLAANRRKQAVDMAEQGLRLVPEHEYLIEVRRELGVRARPTVPLLDRKNPINVSLGQARHAKQQPSGKTARKKR
ncbi:MAG TPA: tetratricopeptide repeat protein [Thermoanaerobaculia bacterium]|nr:tetratricopeptide repeat protein [Thermoanaerobaculia bacterium]